MSERSNDTGPAEAIVLALAASPAFDDDGICFAACQSGLYRSADGGRNWQHALQVSAGTDEPPATAVALSPRFHVDGIAFAAVPGAILRSDDGGTRWNVSTLTTPPPIVSSLVVSPGFSDDGTVIAGTLEDGVFRSEDHGQHWMPSSLGMLDPEVLSLVASTAFYEDGICFAGTSSGVFRSVNGGRSWRECGEIQGMPSVNSLAYTADGVLFAGTEEIGLWRSQDQGGCWTRVGAETVTDTVHQVIVEPDVSSLSSVLVLTDTAILVTHNGGDTWFDWNGDFSLEHGTVAAIAPVDLASDAPILVGRPGCRIQAITSKASTDTGFG